jgi:hypothetical protein
LSEPETAAGPDSRITRYHAAEVKFVVTPDVADRIRAWSRARLAPDPFGVGIAGDEYRITSLYFDTEELDVYTRRGSYARGKYRARRYGTDDGLFLERKLRTSTLLSKRRTRVALDHLKALDANPLVDGPGRWFHKRLIVRGLRPTCQISYRRTARQSPTPYGPMRLTVDDDLRAQRVSDLVLASRLGEPFSDRRLIVELKYRVELPALFKELIETFTLMPQPISKYRLAMDALQQLVEV